MAKLGGVINDFGKIMIRVFTRMDSPSSRLKNVGGQAGEFIRYKAMDRHYETIV